MANKFGRNYRLLVQKYSDRSKFLTIKPPFTIEFNITRTQMPSENTCTIRIFNLGLENRNEILKDQFDQDISRQVVLHAGYGDGPNFPLVFYGNITKATSVREGTNYITTIECFDGGNRFSTNPNLTWTAGTSYQTIIGQLIDSLSVYGIKKGYIGNFEGEVSRGYSPETGIIDTLIRLTGGGFFIDNGVANCLSKNEVFADENVMVIKSDSGLLGTPLREQTILTFTVLFEPNIRIGQPIQLESITAANYDGQYKVISVRHKGTISDAVCGEATTEIEVFYTPTPIRVSATNAFLAGGLVGIA